MNVPIRYREADADDRDGILALRAAAFGESDTYKREPAFWTWEFRRGYAGEASIFVAESGDRIIGHIAFIPQHYETPLGPARAALAVDGMVQPSFHRREIFSALTRHAAACLRGRFAFACGLQIRRASLGGMLAGGWRTIDRLPVLVKPLSFARLGRDFGLPLPERLSARKRSPQVRSITADDLALLSTEGSAVRQPRISAFAQWRYVERPHTTYTIEGWFEHDQLRAAAVHRRAELKGVRTLAIVDAAFAPGAEASLRMLVADICRNAGDNSLAASLLSRAHSAHRILRRSGFVAGPHRFNLLAQVFDHRYDAIIDAPWSLCWGDTDHL